MPISAYLHHQPGGRSTGHNVLALILCTALIFVLPGLSRASGNTGTEQPPASVAPAAQNSEKTPPEPEKESGGQKSDPESSGPSQPSAAPAQSTPQSPAPDTASEKGTTASPESGAEDKKPAAQSQNSGKKQDDDKKKDREKQDTPSYANKELWPSVEALITSPFGAVRGSYSLFGSRTAVRRHGGLDIRAHLGWPVRTLRKGTVVQAGPRGAAGIAVEVRQDNGKRAVYAHLSQVLVREGESVSQGQHIGLVGCTGRTTGAHLHLAMKDADGRTINPQYEITGLWELFDPPASDLKGTIQPQSCDGARHPGGYPYGGRQNVFSSGRPGLYRGRYYGGDIFGRRADPRVRGNRRLRGTEQYLRMRRSLTGTQHYHIPSDIPSWNSR